MTETSLFDMPVLILTREEATIEKVLEEVEPAFEYHWQEFTFFRGFMESRRIVLGSFNNDPVRVVRHLLEEYHSKLVILVGELTKEAEQQINELCEETEVLVKTSDGSIGDLQQLLQDG